MEYLKSIRLQNAKKMLRSNELNITQVAQLCGFNSSSYFTKSFREVFGETPKEFRKR
jgi:AraC-like DNA-binding protein